MAGLLHTIGPYRILEPLGRGGMGVVYRAEHRRSGQRVALKTVRAVDEGTLSGLRREIHALARLSHPQVVRILEEGVEDGLPWYAMELLEGTTLRRLAASWSGTSDTRILSESSVSRRAPGPDLEEPALSTLRWWTDSVAEAGAASATVQPAPLREPAGLPEDRASPPAAFGRLPVALELARALCAPLAFLHGEGIVHRDLKPDNVLVRPEGLPVLVDFGLAAHAGGPLGREVLQIEAGTAGTVAYMAPEQAQGQFVDARADLYALGCILYELLTGRPPFVGTVPIQVLYQHFEMQPVPPSQLVEGVGPELDALVLRLLAKRPRDRFGHAGAVAAALARLGAPDRSVPGAPQPRAYLYRPGFAGRDATLEDLCRLCTRLESGRGGLVLVGGESGVGKTRLVMELARRAEGLKLRVLAGECLPVGMPEPGKRAGGGQSLHPLRGVLQALADRCRERGEAETRRLLGRRGKVLAEYEPALALLPGQQAYPDPAELPAEAARERLFSDLAETFAALSEDRALLLVLDDLQWADDLTLSFLEYLLRAGRLDRTRLLIVGTYRSEEVGAAGRSPLHRMLEEQEVHRLMLGRLDEEAVSVMAGNMLALAPAPRLFARFLARQSEGNPFFVAEYLRTAVAEGLLYRDELGRWQVAQESDAEATEMAYQELPLTTSLRQLVTRRLEGLSTGARKLVRTAAVVGREAPASLLVRMLAPDRGGTPGEASLLEAAAEALQRQVLEEVEPGRLRFVHDKLREVAYENISRPHRKRLHGAAARGIEVLFANEQDKHLAALAYHWEEAGDLDKARTYALAGARKAVARHAPGEAEGLYRSYLARTEQATPESVKARNELARDVLALRGRYEEARLEQHRALEEARLLGDRSSVGLSLRGLAEIHRLTGRADEAVESYGQALQLFRQLPDPEAESRILADLGIAFQEQGRYDQAWASCEQALAILRETGNERQEGQLLNILGSIRHEQGQLEVAIAMYEQALAIHRRTGSRMAEGLAVSNLAAAHQGLGRVSKASTLLEEALAISREVGHRRHEANVLNGLGSVRELQGRLQESQVCYEQALGIFREIGDRRIEAVVLTNLADLYRRLGDPEKGSKLCEQAIAAFRAMGNRRFEGWSLSALALCEADRGRIEAARELFQQALDSVRSLGDRTFEAGMLSALATVERRSGGPLARGERLAREAESIFKGLGNAIPMGECLCERGHAALARGRPGHRLLKQASRLAAAARAGPDSPLGQAIARLERAVEAFDAGRPLFRGERLEDLPEGLRRWLVETGQSAG
jgi:serine/threonine protein kinase/predicted ATPase